MKMVELCEDGAGSIPDERHTVRRAGRCERGEGRREAHQEQGAFTSPLPRRQLRSALRSSPQTFSHLENETVRAHSG